MRGVGSNAVVELALVSVCFEKVALDSEDIPESSRSWRLVKSSPSTSWSASYRSRSALRLAYSVLRLPVGAFWVLPMPKLWVLRGEGCWGPSSSSPSIFFFRFVMKLLTFDWVSRKPFRMLSRMTGRSSTT